MILNLDIYDKDGKLIEAVEDFATLFENREYRRIAATLLPNGYWVSTVWLGINHRYGDGGPPLIFETMVFIGEGSVDVDCRRYPTLAEAQAGHAATVAEWAGRPAIGPVIP